MHKSRLGTVIVDCETDDLEREARFWAAALEMRVFHSHILEGDTTEVMSPRFRPVGNPRFRSWLVAGCGREMRMN